VTGRNLPWTKSQIIEAVRAEMPTEIPPLYAFVRLALGKPEGRASPNNRSEARLNANSLARADAL
jgi:hypothetical protein